MAKKAHADSQPKKKPALTDADRHKRFVDMARELGADADVDPKAFDRAFERVVGKRPKKKA